MAAADTTQGAMSPIALYARIKPLEVDGVAVDKVGGKTGKKQVAGWDEGKASVSIATETDDRVFSHMTGVIGPTATQAVVYETLAQPLVRRWLEGIDVDLISYGQTGYVYVVGI